MLDLIIVDIKLRNFGYMKFLFGRPPLEQNDPFPQTNFMYEVHFYAEMHFFSAPLALLHAKNLMHHRLFGQENFNCIL